MTARQMISVKDKSDEPSPVQNGAALYDEVYAEAGQYVSEAIYWDQYYENSDLAYEWNNGRLEEKPMPDYAQYRLYLWFLGLVKDYLYVTESGRMIALELGFRLALARKVAIRKPDLAVVLNTNPIALKDKDRSYKGIFDLCIESISDSTRGEVERDTVVKWQEYAAAGVQEYFVLDERGIETEFYQLRNGVYAPIQPVKGVIHSQILPGFQFRLADLYRLPELPQLIEDPVYQAFVSPFLRAERLRAEAANQQAEQERIRAEEANQRAEQERIRAEEADQRAERYAALLKSMGVAVDEIDNSQQQFYQ
jgi:Uma2 family endonuclease